jgi:small subunit ribosomal protein S20
MPITSSAKKALRASKKKRAFNLRRKDEMSGVIKQYKKLVSAKKMDEAKKLIPSLQKAIDKAAKRGIIKPNNASRKKSRLIKVINFKTA